MYRLIREDTEIIIDHQLPVLPLKDVVVFPYMIFPLLVGRERSLRAVQDAALAEKLLFLTAQKDPLKEEPTKDDLYRIGTVARVLQVLKLPNGLMKVLIEGLIRGRVRRFLRNPDHFEARIEVIPESTDESPQVQAKLRRVVTLFKDYVHLNRNIPDEVLLSIEQFEHPQRLADFISAHVQREMRVKQRLLEAVHVSDQLLALAKLLQSENEILEIEQNLDEKVRSRIQRSQRNFYLQEQMRVIQEELGEEAETDGEILQLRERLEKARLPEQALEKANEELEKLRNTPPFSPEATVIRNYLEWLLTVPWHKKTKDNLDIEEAKKILDEDHYGLTKVKERILEHLAVLKLVKSMRGPILCFVGPPGVGKTSLGRSVARAMGRKFIRVSLGGVRDEAEIRGHRRTYIGSMPGKIIQSMKRAGTVNPVFLLDEVDKMSVDFRGDPSAALLEVLDPEQNKFFNDHYLEVDYDLSQVMFITTANLRSQIPEPLQDRMEILNLPGYLEHEKVEIAIRHLLPKLLKEHGLKKKQVQVQPSAIRRIIREYTREAGVRNLERELASICRKVAREVAANASKNGKSVSYRITARTVPKYLGVPRYTDRPLDETEMVGAAVGLAWTRYGGDILQIEVSLMKGKGNLSLTGKLGDVMKESARAALSYARSNAKRLNITGEFWKTQDIHIHIPEGAIPKDGPSAGITMATALISALTGRAVRKEMAMTGEITLRGNVLAVGGLNEKLLAAQRVGLKTVIVPAENEKDLIEIPKQVKRGLEIVQVKHMDEVLDLALVPKE